MKWGKREPEGGSGKKVIFVGEMSETMGKKRIMPRVLGSAYLIVLAAHLLFTVSSPIRYLVIRLTG